MKDYYAILHIPPDATQQKIRQAYRREIWFFHPDRWPLDHPMRPVAEERTKEINEAYQILSDPIKRREYDESRMWEDILRSVSEWEDWVATQDPTWQTGLTRSVETQGVPPVYSTPHYETPAPRHGKQGSVATISILIVIVFMCYVLAQIDWLKIFGDILGAFLRALIDWIA